MTRFFRRPLGNILKDLSLIFLVVIIIISLDRFTLTNQSTSDIGEQVEHCDGSPTPCEIVEPVQPIQPVEPTEVVQEPDNGQYNKLYVSSSGNDLNDCTSSAPCLSFEKAQSLATPGDTIYLSGFLGAITVTKSGTADARLSIVGQDVLLNGLRIEADYINVYSVEVAGAISHGIYVESKYVLIENSIVRNSVTENGINGECPGDNQWGSGIKARIGAENLILRGNSVFNNCGEGIAITRGINVLVENNVVGSNYSVGIYIDNSYNVIAQNNTVICDDTYLRNDHRMRGMVFAAEEYDGWGMQLHDNSFLNNTVIGCYDSYNSWAAYDESISVNLTMDGNISIDSTRHSINVSSISENMIISNNILDRPIYIEDDLDTSSLSLINNQVTNQSP